MPQPQSKSELRAAIVATRDDVDLAVRARAAASIRARLVRSEAVRTARTVLAYAAFGSEVDLDPLLWSWMRAGRGVFLPFVRGWSPPDLGIARVRDLDTDVVPSRLGIREPDPATRRAARADRVDVVIAPGVAFDRRGGRLGYGGGFYDRLLRTLPATTPVIAVAFEVQVVDAVPTDAHDVAVAAIVTERRLITADASCQ